MKKKLWIAGNDHDKNKDMLFGYANQTLSITDKKKFEMHLPVCSICQTDLQLLQRLWANQTESNERLLVSLGSPEESLAKMRVRRNKLLNETRSDTVRRSFVDGFLKLAGSIFSTPVVAAAEFVIIAVLVSWIFISKTETRELARKQSRLIDIKRQYEEHLAKHNQQNTIGQKSFELSSSSEGRMVIILPTLTTQEVTKIVNIDRLLDEFGEIDLIVAQNELSKDPASKRVAFSKMSTNQITKIVNTDNLLRAFGEVTLSIESREKNVWAIQVPLRGKPADEVESALRAQLVKAGATIY